MSPFCQIELANDDVGMPCGKPAVWQGAATVDLRSAPTVQRNAAEMLSAVSAMTTT